MNYFSRSTGILAPESPDSVHIDLKKGMSEVGNTETVEKCFTIYRIPPHICKANEYYYEPRLISIGPYHREKPHLRAMEEHKWRYLRDFMSKCAGIDEDYIYKMRELEPLVRESYFESVKLPSDEFVKMLLLDGCFIIELLIKFKDKEKDPVFNVGWTLPLLLGDLIMLENQIPFIVVRKLYELYAHDESRSAVSCKPTLVELITEFLTHLEGERNEVRIPEGRVYHFLHVYYLFYIPDVKSVTEPVKPTNCLNTKKLFSFISCQKLGQPCLPTKKIPRMIPCAKELEEFGVTFKKRENANNFLDVSFLEGVLEIPCNQIEESTKSMYMNLIAFEQCNGNGRKDLTSYAVLMDRLINSADDVRVLQKSGILENKLANAEEVAKFFNHLSSSCYVNFENHYLAPVFRDVKFYCEECWPKHRAKLCRDYFSSPWAMFSLGAGLLVLSITVLRTICFIISDLFHHKI